MSTPVALIIGAKELDALAAVLPMAAADRYAAILTDTDVATLRHLADAGVGANTLRALASDLAYLEAWSQAPTGIPCPGRPIPSWCSSSLPITFGIQTRRRSI